MIDFIAHPSFEPEIAELEQRFHNVEKAVIEFKKLCGFHFHPQTPQQVIAPAKLHRVTQNDIWSLWKIELAVKGLRSNQSPRVWFAIKGSTLVLLSAQSHVDNYNDNTRNEVAISRASEFF